MNPHLSFLLNDLPRPSRHNAPLLPPLTMASSSTHYPLDWRPHPSQSTLFAGALAPSGWTNAGPPTLPEPWSSGPHDFLLPFHHYPTKEYDAGPDYAYARSDTSSAVSRDSDLSPSPEVAEVVCNAPLVAPVPLPYHSPTFLMYDLPDEDEDLSHPPYTHRPHKRKRARDEDDDDESSDARREAHPAPAKRRLIVAPGMPRGWPGAAAVPAVSAATAALRHPAASFSRRNRAR